MAGRGPKTKRYVVPVTADIELEMSDWRCIEGKTLLTRTMSYIKPLNGSIGPKQTKCHIVDEQDHFGLDDYISLVTTTRTPDVPSGGVFSVKTRTCLTWAGGNSTRMLVTSTVEWTGKSWVKGESTQNKLIQASLKNPPLMVKSNTTKTS